MLSGWKTRPALKWFVSVMLLLMFCVLGSGCREVGNNPKRDLEETADKSPEKEEAFYPEGRHYHAVMLSLSDCQPELRSHPQASGGNAH